MVFERLREGQVHLSPSKCLFTKPEFEVLGHLCMKDSVSPNPKKVQAIIDYPMPESQDQLRRYLGLATWLS